MRSRSEVVSCIVIVAWREHDKGRRWQNRPPLVKFIGLACERVEDRGEEALDFEIYDRKPPNIRIRLKDHILERNTI